MVAYNTRTLGFLSHLASVRLSLCFMNALKCLDVLVGSEHGHAGETNVGELGDIATTVALLAHADHDQDITGRVLTLHAP